MLTLGHQDLDEHGSGFALHLLLGYAWPGNIRELENLMERSVLFADGPRIEASALPDSEYSPELPRIVLKALARDLRVIVRERLTAGDDDAQVQSYVVGRYGEYVLLRPVFALHTLLLWLTPIAVVILGLFGLWRLSRRRVESAPEGLSAAEQAEITALTRRD